MSRSAFLLLLAAALARGAYAQAPTATIRGRVVDRSTAAGIARSQLLLVDEGRSVVTDSTGRFTFGRVPSGTVRIRVRALGFPPADALVELRPGEDAVRTIELDSTAASRGTQVLDTVDVSAEAPPQSYRLVDFERRRQTGRGHYMTEQEIVRSGASNLQDLMRGLRGVTVACSGGRGCWIHMVRARPNCEPDYVIDGRADNMFGASTPIRDIIALEVYTGPADAPGEFTGVTAGCGVIVIWTRSGPTRRKH